MRTLAFAARGTASDGKRVRDAYFEERSVLPLSAACVVASGVRETLSTSLGMPIVVRLYEAAIPSPQAWTTITHGALLYRVRAPVTDAAIVLRPADAIALAAAAFGETAGEQRREREPSPIERDLLDRVVGAIAGSLSAVCGKRERETVERVNAISGFASYFELSLEQPVEARIGIALLRDPVPEPHGRLTLDDLGTLPLSAALVLEVGTIEAVVVAGLTTGTIVPITQKDRFHGSLELAGRTIGRGACGVRGGRYALAMT